MCNFSTKGLPGACVWCAGVCDGDDDKREDAASEEQADCDNRAGPAASTLCEPLTAGQEEQQLLQEAQKAVAWSRSHAGPEFAAPMLLLLIDKMDRLATDDVHHNVLASLFELAEVIFMQVVVAMLYACSSCSNAYLSNKYQSSMLHMKQVPHRRPCLHTSARSGYVNER